MCFNWNKMAERPEDLSLPASVVARIIKDAVRVESQFKKLLIRFNIYKASRRSECFQGGENCNREGCKCIHLICHSLVRLVSQKLNHILL